VAQKPGLNDRFVDEEGTALFAKRGGLGKDPVAGKKEDSASAD